MGPGMTGRGGHRGRRHPGRRTTRGSARQQTMQDAQAIYLASLEPPEPPPARGSDIERIWDGSPDGLHYITTKDGEVVVIKIRKG